MGNRRTSISSSGWWGACACCGGDGVEVTPKGRKAQGLLALIGVAPELRRHRSWLQDKLWSDRPPEQGAASLRQELAGIRRALGEASACLSTDGGWVALDPGRVRVRLDPDPDDWELTGAPPEFVAGLDIADPEFEDWIRDQRAVFAERLEAAGPPRAVGGRRGCQDRPAPVEFEDVQPSIAVMPLTLLGDLPEGPLVAAGLAMDVIGLLTRFRRLDAIAYSSTSALPPGLPAREIGARLGARYVTQGVLWLSRTRMRLAFDLILAETERVVWSHSFDRDCDDLFDVEREVAAAVAAGTMVEIDHLERSRVRARDPNGLPAYSLWLRGLDDMLSLRPAALPGRARALLSRGLASTRPTRARCRASRAPTASAGSIAGPRSARRRWPSPRSSRCRRSMPTRTTRGASAALGWVALYQRDHDRSLEAYRHAMELNPSDADVLAEYADALKHSGAPDEAVPLFERADPAQPLFGRPVPARTSSHTHFVREDYEAAIRTVRRMRRKSTILRTLAASQAMLGLDDDARETVRLLREVGHGPIAAGRGLGDDDPRPRPELYRAPARRHEARRPLASGAFRRDHSAAAIAGRSRSRTAAGVRGPG